MVQFFLPGDLHKKQKVDGKGLMVVQAMVEGTRTEADPGVQSITQKGVKLCEQVPQP